MLFDDEPQFFDNSENLNQRLYDDVYHYLADNTTDLEDSDAMLWVEADQADHELLNEVNEVIPSHMQFAWERQNNSDGTFEIKLSRNDQFMQINYDAPDAWDDDFGYLFATLKAAQQFCPGLTFCWWIGLEEQGELEDGVRPLVILTYEQWDMLSKTFGVERLQSEFKPIA